MNINATLFGQMITFAVLVWFTMRFIWPPLIEALKERQQKIADGLSAAKQGEAALSQAKVAIENDKEAARQARQDMLNQANRQATQLVETAKRKATDESKRLLTQAQQEIDRQAGHARDTLRKEVGALVITLSEKLMAKTVDPQQANQLVDQFIAELQEG